MNQHEFSIERYTLLTESAPELGGRFDEWYGFYRPATPGECTLVDLAVMASVQQKRVLACLTEIINEQIRTARFQFDCEQEDQVQHYRGLLETEPGAAVVGLKRSALGVRFLIERWERLLLLLREQGTLYGNDRDEFIAYQGARARKPENLFESETAYLTWLYCLMCQPQTKDQDLVDLGNERYMPESLHDRNVERWVGEFDTMRKVLRQRGEAELAQLRRREGLLRKNFEDPGRDGAEIRKQVLQDPAGARLLREAESHGRQFHRAYQALLSGRAQSEKTRRLPGAPHEDLHPESVELVPRRVGPGRETVTAEQATAQRKDDAGELAPGGANGIGAPARQADNFRAGLLEAEPLEPEVLEAKLRAEAEANGEVSASTGFSASSGKDGHSTV